MKTLMGVGLLFFLSTIARAQTRNPDRYVSVGLKVENYYTHGDYTTISGPDSLNQLVERGSAREDYVGLGLNLRIPATDSLTIDFDYMALDGERRHNRRDTYQDTADLDGYKAGVGFRFYFNQPRRTP
jgi:hypothetical protein